MELREITTGLRFPEGPVALPDGSVLVVEIARRTLTRVEADGHKEVVAETGGGPNGAAIGPDGKCYLCNNGGFEWHEDGQGLRPILQARDYSGGRIERVDLDTGRVELLYTHAGDIALKGPNDIVFDAHGGFWFTDLGKVRVDELDRGRVFYAKADGSSCREVVFPIVTPNGLGLSPDGTRLYVAETEPSRLWEFQEDLMWAEVYGYTVEITDLFDGGLSDEELAARNTHGVSIEIIAKQRARWEQSPQWTLE